MTVGMATAVVVAGALGTAVWTWVEWDRMVRLTAISGLVNAALQEATVLRGQARAVTPADPVAWTKALAAAQKARDLIEPGLDLTLRRQVEPIFESWLISDTFACWRIKGVSPRYRERVCFRTGSRSF
jgi:hypothetical protein